MKRCLYLSAIILLFTGCANSINEFLGPDTKSILSKDAKYFKGTRNIPLQKLSLTVFPSHSVKVDIFETEQDIYLVDYNRIKYKTVDVIPLSTGIKREYFLSHKYKSGVEFSSLKKGAKPLSVTKVDNQSLFAYSNKHKTLLFINTDSPIDKISYTSKRGFDVRYPYLGTAYDFQIEFINYKQTLSKIKQLITSKQYESLYNIKDKYIKKFIKSYLIESLLKIDSDIDLERFAPLLSNFGISQVEGLLLVQGENIDIINQFKSIKTKMDKKIFINKKNRIFEVVDKKLSIRDEPNYKTSEILGYYKKGDIVLSEEFKGKWILTEQGWINKSYLKSKDTLLKEYKTKAKRLDL